MLKHISKIYRPDSYHGAAQKSPFFEGWFFKLVDSAKSNIYAIIPGVFFSEDHAQSHAFVQVLEGHTGKSEYFRYPLTEFRSKKTQFHIEIAQSNFSKDKLELNLNGENWQIRGQLRFKNLYPWPVTWLSPGVMGPYAFAPFMQCYHGVVSMDHDIQGDLSINDQVIEFQNGKGYTEKDWGSGFPSAYIWAQCNHFEMPGVSVMVSVANIPWLRSSFCGFLAGVLLAGKLYRLTTYTGAKLQKVSVLGKRIEILITQASKRLELTIEQQTSGMLHGPYEAEMAKKVTESLNSTMRVKFFDNEKLLFQGEGTSAGLDVNGNLDEILLDEVK